MPDKKNLSVTSLFDTLPRLNQINLETDKEAYQSTVEGSVKAHQAKSIQKQNKHEKIVLSMKQQLLKLKKCSFNFNSSKSSYQQYKNRCPCCRPCFINRQCIPHKQNIIFLDHENLFSQQNLQDTVQACCALSNSNQGGHILLGIKQSLIKQYRIVLGTLLTKIDLQSIHHIFKTCFSSRIINQSQYKLNYSIDCPPVRQSLFPELTFHEYLKRDQHDQLIKIINPQNYPFIQGKYLIRIKVKPGDVGMILSCLDKQGNIITHIMQNGKVNCLPLGREIANFLSKRVFEPKKYNPRSECQNIQVEKGIPISSISQFELLQQKKRANKIRQILDYQDKVNETKHKNQHKKLNNLIYKDLPIGEVKLRKILSRFQYFNHLKIVKINQIVKINSNQDKQIKEQQYFIIINLQKDLVKSILYDLINYLTQFDNEIKISLKNFKKKKINQNGKISKYFGLIYTLPVYPQEYQQFLICNETLFDRVKRENIQKLNKNSFKKNKQ